MAKFKVYSPGEMVEVIQGPYKGRIGKITDVEYDSELNQHVYSVSTAGGETLTPYHNEVRLFRTTKKYLFAKEIPHLKGKFKDQENPPIPLSSADTLKWFLIFKESPVSFTSSASLKDKIARFELLKSSIDFISAEAFWTSEVIDLLAKLGMNPHIYNKEKDGKFISFINYGENGIPKSQFTILNKDGKLILQDFLGCPDIRQQILDFIVNYNKNSSTGVQNEN